MTISEAGREETGDMEVVGEARETAPSSTGWIKRQARVSERLLFAPGAFRESQFYVIYL